MGNECSDVCKVTSHQDGEYKKENISLILENGAQEVKIVADRISKVFIF